MATTTNVEQVKLNIMTQAQYNSATKSDTELYMVTDATPYFTASCPAITPIDGVATWNITHNLNTTNVLVALYTSGGVEIVKNVSITTANAISVQFMASSNVTAGSYKIVITGA